MKYQIHKLTLPRGASLPAVTFSLKASIVSLLPNCELMKEENLLLNKTIPFQSSEISEVLGNINTGWWFHKTKKSYCSKPNKVLLPLIFFIDGSNVDKNSCLSVKPVTMTLGIFNCATCNVSDAWRTMGFIENMMNKVSDDVAPSRQPSAKLQEYHAVLDHIFF